MRRQRVARSVTDVLSSEQRIHLRKRIQSMPTGPGVYRWLDVRGQVLYVGKAVNLKRRLLQYVTGSHQDEGVCKQAMFGKLWDVEVTVTDTEVAALILEANMIRSLKPPYNVALVRDRSQGFVRVGLQEDFPSVTLVARRADDGARYFGPFRSLRSQEVMLERLRRVFPFRTCGMGIHLVPVADFAARTLGSPRLTLELQKPDRRVPCLDHHIHRCSAPCDGSIDQEAYRAQCVEPVVAFYEGQFSTVLDRLVATLRETRGDRKYNRILDITEMLKSIRSLQLQHQFLGLSSVRVDAVGLAPAGNGWQASVLQVRGGNVVNHIPLTLRGGETIPEALSGLLQQYYGAGAEIPERILTPVRLVDRALLAAWLTSVKGQSVAIAQPRRAEEKRVVLLALRNAETIEEVRQVKAEVGDSVAGDQLSLFGGEVSGC